MIYPWNDLHKQEGIWETIHTAYNRFLNSIEEETYIWIDLTKEEAKDLPKGHPFTLPSPWVLYGLTRESYEAW